MEQCFRITIGDAEFTYPARTTFREIADAHKGDAEPPVVLVRMNGEVQELFKEVTQDGTLEFITTSEQEGMAAYRRSGLFLMEKAFADLTADSGRTVRVLFTMDQAYYCEVFEDGKQVRITEEFLRQLERHMRTLVDLDLPVTKKNVSMQEADAVFCQHDLKDRRRLFRYRMSSRVNLYKIWDYSGYQYGHLFDRTGLLQKFELLFQEEQGGFFLNFPSLYEPEEVDEFVFQPKLFSLQLRDSVWAADLDLATVGALNDRIAGGTMQDVVLAQEAAQEQEIGRIAEQIALQGALAGGKKFILIAGPTSSGKTTFSHRLSIQLMSRGYKPHPIAMDDFFLDREKMIRQPDGSLDFEAVEAVDIDLFNDTMLRLLNGECVQMPTFDFREGIQKFTGRSLQIGREDILVIEGIHGLNPIFTESLPRESTYRIYISALSPLKMDEHNCLSTRDMRLLRRIVRDARTRGTPPAQTLAGWDSVRRGEERHIFPFQENADSMFNSSLIYELPVLKLYAEPRLYDIPKEDPAYPEARRLLKFLVHSLSWPSEGIAAHSILREFIGGSCFGV